MEIYASYMRVVMPLQGLKGLSKLFVHVAWPWEWTERGRQAKRKRLDAVRRVVWSVEARLEKLVMGVGYESARVGKGKLRDSQWTEDWSGW